MSSTKHPPRKRAREDTSGSELESSQRVLASAPHIIHREKQFWYDDGNIIIVAQDIAFRLYKGLLASESEVLREILTGDTAASTKYVLRTSTHSSTGCPMVFVTDTAAEFRSLLSILIRGRQYLGNVTREFDDIVNCARLAHKYRIQDVLESSLATLMMYFPTSAEGWRNRVRCEPPAKAIMARNVGCLTGSPIQVMALYQCFQLGSTELVEGVKRADGTVERLSLEDLKHCISAKACLSARYVQMYNGLFNALEASERCKTKQHCKQVVVDVRRVWDSQIIISHTVTGLLDFDWGDVVDSAKKCFGGDPNQTPDHDWILCADCSKLLEDTLKEILSREFYPILNILGLAPRTSQPVLQVAGETGGGGVEAEPE